MLSKNVHPYVTLVAVWKSHVYASGKTFKKNYQGSLREILTDVTTVTSTAGL